MRGWGRSEEITLPTVQGNIGTTGLSKKNPLSKKLEMEILLHIQSVSDNLPVKCLHSSNERLCPVAEVVPTLVCAEYPLLKDGKCLNKKGCFSSPGL